MPLRKLYYASEPLLSTQDIKRIDCRNICPSADYPGAVMLPQAPMGYRYEVVVGTDSNRGTNYLVLVRDTEGGC